MAGIGAARDISDVPLAAQDSDDGLLARLGAIASASASADSKAHQVYFVVSYINPQVFGMA